MQPILAREIKSDLIVKIIELGDAAKARKAVNTRTVSFDALTQRESGIVELMAQRLSKNILKKYFTLLPAAVLCLCLTACFNIFDDPVITGDDWRTWGLICDSGTITRGGVDTKVLVCVYENRTDFFYDSKEQVMFGSVDYPLTILLAGDKLRDIDFADLNDDGNSDVTMKFDDGGSEVVLVWFWDAESEQFVFRPEESQLSVPELMGGELPFNDMENLQSEIHEDSTYYYSDAAEDGSALITETMEIVFSAEDFREYPIEYTGSKKTADELADELSKLIGPDFSITASETDDGLIVDWAHDSTLIAGLDNREQKQEFFFFDNITLSWFMMDSLCRNLTENLGVENIYYTMNGGEKLVVYEMKKDVLSSPSGF